MSIVEVALLVIVEDFVGLASRFEANFSFGAFRFCDFVGMMGQCGLYRGQHEHSGAFIFDHIAGHVRGKRTLW